MPVYLVSYWSDTKYPYWLVRNVPDMNSCASGRIDLRVPQQIIHWTIIWCEMASRTSLILQTHPPWVICYVVCFICCWSRTVKNTYLYSMVGWVDIGTSTWVSLEYIIFFCKSTENSKKSDLLRKGHSFWGQALYKDPNFFCS
jgi:hypothetical protein